MAPKDSKFKKEFSRSAGLLSHSSVKDNQDFELKVKEVKGRCTPRMSIPNNLSAKKMILTRDKLLLLRSDTLKNDDLAKKIKNPLLVKSMVAGGPEMENIEWEDDSSLQNLKNPRNSSSNLLNANLEEDYIGFINMQYKFVLPTDDLQAVPEEKEYSLDKLNIFKALGIQQEENTEEQDMRVSLQILRDIIQTEVMKYSRFPLLCNRVQMILNWESICCCN